MSRPAAVPRRCARYKLMDASHLSQSGSGVRTVQERLGHADVATTTIYTRALRLDVWPYAYPLIA